MRTSNESLYLYLKTEAAGEVWLSKELDFSKEETKDLLTIATCFARIGCVVLIPNPVHFRSESYQTIFGRLMGTRYERKCPDLLIDDAFYEYESYSRPWNKRKLSNMLSHGLRQSDRVIIDGRGGVPIRQILRSIRLRQNINSYITEIWVYDGTGVLQIYP